MPILATADHFTPSPTKKKKEKKRKEKKLEQKIISSLISAFFFSPPFLYGLRFWEETSIN